MGIGLQVFVRRIEECPRVGGAAPRPRSSATPSPSRLRTTNHQRAAASLKQKATTSRVTCDVYEAGTGRNLPDERQVTSVSRRLLEQSGRTGSVRAPSCAPSRRGHASTPQIHAVQDVLQARDSIDDAGVPTHRVDPGGGRPTSSRPARDPGRRAAPGGIQIFSLMKTSFNVSRSAHSAQPLWVRRDDVVRTPRAVEDRARFGRGGEHEPAAAVLAQQRVEAAFDVAAVIGAQGPVGADREREVRAALRGQGSAEHLAEGVGAGPVRQRHVERGRAASSRPGRAIGSRRPAPGPIVRASGARCSTARAGSHGASRRYAGSRRPRGGTARAVPGASPAARPSRPRLRPSRVRASPAARARA